MITIYGIPLFGTLFIPISIGVLTLFMIWSFTSRENEVKEIEITASDYYLKLSSEMDENVTITEEPSESSVSEIFLPETISAPRKKRTFNEKKKGCGGKDGKCCNDCKKGKVEASDKFSEDLGSSSDEVSENEMLNDGVMDMEELGAVLAALREDDVKKEGNKEMLTPVLREALSKQGYLLVGTHSGLKICRWTKSMLRGRGGCYKHSFYGIESHRCMETTPSLACANKCVFCWRHQSNPVATEWLWKSDSPEDILTGTLDHHYNKINQLKDLPGVLEERLAEGMAVKHCALSLVGEPIMYPEINNYVRLLHSKGISTFLVTNAQFPDAIRHLSPVTQLYVSVDGCTKESLKKIDRPLFKDFWERFNDSLTAMSEKGQRIVYRLTLIKKWNTDDIEGYAKLIERGQPDFIEVKGLTYCGSSKASKITMQNVPLHKEVLTFVQTLANNLANYEIASEHEHSNCVLIAHKKYKVDNEWWTWIDYDKFFELVDKFYASNGERSFTGLDYMSKTPSWASFGSLERGFSPSEKRWIRKASTNTSLN